MLTDRDTPPISRADASRRTDPDGGACLVPIHGPSVGMRFALARGDSIVGRDAGCDVPLPIDTVSRRHCRVAVRGDEVLLTDLGSTNGTARNDEPLAPHEEVALRPGDRVRVGSAILVFLQGDDVDARYREVVHRTVVEDALTGAGSAPVFEQFVAREMARSRRHGRALSLVAFDLDDLKRVNDDFGQLTGDEVLRAVAGLVRGQVRREDCFARLAGGAFAVALTETAGAAARYFAERLRGTIEAHELRAGGEPIAVTISAGVASLADATREPADLLAAADARLCEAKSAGGNRVG